MKQFFSIIFLSIITFQSFADTTTVVSDIMNSAESTMTAIDTSSLYKQIYSDVKIAISGMADALKVGAEHVYIILVKQQRVKSIVNLIVGIFGFILLYITSKLGNTCWQNPSFQNIGAIFTGIASFFILLFFLVTLNETVTGFVNPEYGAMKELVTWVK
jgi:hypothetical protein